jgi:hypothetical protein
MSRASLFFKISRQTPMRKQYNMFFSIHCQPEAKTIFIGRELQQTCLDTLGFICDMKKSYFLLRLFNFA